MESVKRARKLCLKVSFAVSRAPESYMSKVTRTYEIVFCLAVVSRASTHGGIPTIDKYEVCCGKISVVTRTHIFSYWGVWVPQGHGECTKGINKYPKDCKFLCNSECTSCNKNSHIV